MVLLTGERPTPGETDTPKEAGEAAPPGAAILLGGDSMRPRWTEVHAHYTKGKKGPTMRVCTVTTVHIEPFSGTLVLTPQDTTSCAGEATTHKI